MLAIDTSGSMAATDVAPEPARRRAGRGPTLHPGSPCGPEDRAPAVRHRARVLVASPTTDHVPVLAAVDSLTVGGGTATGSADRSVRWRRSPRSRRVDGKKVAGRDRAHERRLADDRQRGETRRADGFRQRPRPPRQAKVPIDTIAFGTPTGTVTVQGENVPVPADPQAMAAIAQGSGGKSFTATTAASSTRSTTRSARRSASTRCRPTSPSGSSAWRCCSRYSPAAPRSGGCSASRRSRGRTRSGAKLAHAECNRRIDHARVRRARGAGPRRRRGGIRRCGAAAAGRSRRARRVSRPAARRTGSCAPVRGAPAVVPGSSRVRGLPRRSRAGPSSSSASVTCSRRSKPSSWTRSANDEVVEIRARGSTSSSRRVATGSARGCGPRAFLNHECLIDGCDHTRPSSSRCVRS